MARVSRTVLNRQALDAIDLGIASGLEALALRVLEVARVPDAPPIGKGLLLQGGVISYVDGKRVGGDRSIRKPRKMTVRGKGVMVGVGYGFPGRFVETGTEHSAPEPFLTPAVMEVVGDQSTVITAMRESNAKVLGKQQRRAYRAAAS